MDKLINFLLLVICLVIIVSLLFNKESIERFGFSNNDIDYYHDFNITQRRNYDLFVEDNSTILITPKLNNPVRDVNELMNYDCNGKDIYDMTRVRKDKNYVNNLNFW